MLSPEKLVSLRKSLLADELQSWKYERFAYLTMCLVCLTVTLVAVVIYIMEGNFKLSALSIGGAGGVLGVSVASLLMFVDKTRKTVDSIMKTYLPQSTNVAEETTAQ